MSASNLILIDKSPSELKLIQFFVRKQGISIINSAVTFWGSIDELNPL